MKLVNRHFLHLLEMLVLVLVSLLVVVHDSEGAIAVAHSHRHEDRRSPSREREADGAYSPRDKSHFESSDGTGHRSEYDHEAILGSAKEAEEFDNLPPEEAKARLAILVGKMDLDKNGQIERAELKAWIIRSFKMLSEEESKERLDEVDANEDGRVTWKEYVQETFGVDLDGADSNIPLDDIEEQQMLSDDRALFHAADTNRDGYLDAVEFISFTHPEEDPKMLPVIYQQTLDSKDLNKDGDIDFKEFIGDRGIDKDKEWLDSEKDRFDNELDKNRDGLLDRQEILSWVLPSNEEIADEEVAHLFGASDDNHNDVLSYEEILDHHETFVGSEATDYGDHLHNLEKFKDEL